MKAESDYGFGDTGDTGKEEVTSEDKPALSENLMHVSVYFDSFNKPLASKTFQNEHHFIKLKIFVC